MTSSSRRLFKASAVSIGLQSLSLEKVSATSNLQMLRGAFFRASDGFPRPQEPATLAHCPAAPVVTPRPQGANFVQTQRPFSSRVEAGRAAPTSPLEASGPASTSAASRSEADNNRQTPITKVPGVGLRNAVRLKAKGFSTVEALQQLFVEEHKQKKEEMIKYLQADVGIRHRKYCSSIANFLAELKPAGEAEQLSRVRQRLTLCVEGNISAGKSTFLQALAADDVELQDRLPLSVVQEPVAKWQGSGNGGPNLLQMFYKDPARYAYTFQNYVFMTRVMQEKESNQVPDPLRLMERSVFSDRMVFVKAVHEAHWMTDMELSVYDAWFDPLLNILPSLIPDGFIYLRAQPETCLKRLQVRARSEEGAVDLGYLENLHEKHENWLFPSARQREGSWGGLGEPDIIKDKVGLLQANRHHALHPLIENVPALILECDDHMDLARDPSAQSHIKAQVSAYYDFLQRRKEASLQEKSIHSVLGSQLQQLQLPNGQLLHADRAQLDSMISSGQFTNHLMNSSQFGSSPMSNGLMTARQ